MIDEAYSAARQCLVATGTLVMIAKETLVCAEFEQIEYYAISHDAVAAVSELEDAIEKFKSVVAADLIDFAAATASEPAEVGDSCYASYLSGSREFAQHSLGYVYTAMRNSAADLHAMKNSWLDMVRVQRLCRGLSSVEDRTFAKLEMERARVKLSFPKTLPEVNTDKGSVHSRMMYTLDKIPESRGWTIRQWSLHLGCSKASIGDTQAWAAIKVTRADAKITRLNEQKRTGHNRR